MKQNTTRIAIILDRSGSMFSVRQATIDGFNEFINQQKQEPGEASIKLVQFDDQYEPVFDKPLADVPKLTNTTFEPRGMTALHDAIGKTVAALGQELSALPEQDRPGKVVVVILTDGGENSSREYSHQQVAEMVKHQQDKYNWTFLFIGANQDAVLTASGFNISAANSLTYNSNAASTKATFSATSRAVRSARVGNFVGYTEAERNDAQQ